MNKLKRIGGKTPKDSVRHAIAHILSTSVGSQYTWHGLRGKDALKATSVGKCFISTFCDADMTEYDVGVLIGDWLRHERRQIRNPSYHHFYLIYKIKII